MRCTFQTRWKKSRDHSLNVADAASVGPDASSMAPWAVRILNVVRGDADASSIRHSFLRREKLETADQVFLHHLFCSIKHISNGFEIYGSSDFFWSEVSFVK